MKKQNFIACALTITSCLAANAQVTVYTAAQLETAINCTSGCATTINIADTTIYLGEISMDKFPLIVKPGVTIQGTFDMFKSAAFQGSTLQMPYAFKNGEKCTYDVNIQGSVFSLKDSSQVKNIKLIGPNTYTKDYNMFPYKVKELCGDTSNIQPLDGLAAGIIAQGTHCKIQDCEILGFPLFGVKVHPIYVIDQCSDNADRDFYMERCYVHNNKGYGYGYGIYITGGLQSTHCKLGTGCSNAVGNFFNFDSPLMKAYVTQCYFAENATDIDGSGNRCSYYISGSTFTNRGLSYNIYRHDANGLSIYNPADTTKILSKNVGGNVTSIQDNIFYKGGGDVNSNYPNINDCNHYPSQEGYALINNNYFYSAAGNLNSNILLADSSYVSWLNPLHTHLSFTGNTACATIPLHPAAQAPYCNIRSRSSTQGSPVFTEQFISVGDTLFFDTEFCFDSYGNAGNSASNNLIYLWRFHENKNDLADEIRTGFKTASGPLVHVFNRAGVTYANLMAIDKNTRKASVISTQKITVKPANPSAHTYLSFHVLDSYQGYKLKSFGSCNTYSDNTQAADTTPTGFVKYVKINNQLDSILGDVAGDNGWERFEFPIEQYLKSDAPGGANDTIEIGVKALYSVPVTKVRGLIFFLDDVYINKPDGTNILLNPGFENNQATGHPDKWQLVAENEHLTFSDSCTGSATLNLNGGLSTTLEPRSGLYSFWGYIKGFPDVNIADGWVYPSGKYKGVWQSFNLNSCLVSAAITPAWPLANCTNEGVLLTANTGSGNSYQWKLNGSNISGATSSTYRTFSSGSYTVVVTNTCGSATSTAVTVTINTSPTVTVTASPSNVCPGQHTTLSASGAPVFNWYPVATLSDSTGSSVTATPFVNTTYYVVGIDTNGCRDTANVSINMSTISITASSDDYDLCPGQSASLSASGANTYAWSPSGSLSSSSGSTVTATPSVNTDYTVIGTDTLGCTDTALVAITVHHPDVIITSSADSVCSGLQATLTASGASSYAWSPAASLSDSTGAVVIATPSATTTYTVIGTDSYGCLDTTTKNIVIRTETGSTPSQPSAITGLATGLCNISQSYTSATVSGATQYYWTVPSYAYIQSGQGTINMTAFFNTSAITTEFVCVRAVASGCKKSTGRCISVYGKPGSFASPAGTTPACKDSTYEYTLANWSAGALSSKGWLLSPSSYGTLTVTDSVHVNVQWTHTGTPLVCAIASNGCGNRTNILTVTVNNCMRSGDFEPSLTTSGTLQVFPNPTKDLLFVAGLPSDFSMLEVRDAQGKLLNVWSGSPSECILDVKEYAEGIYLLLAKTKGGDLLKTRFVVLK